METLQKLHESASAGDHQAGKADEMARPTKARTFGLMTDVVLTTPYSFDIVRGLQAEFSNRGQTVLVANTDDSSNREDGLWRMFHAHQLHGVIYASMHHRAHVLGETPFGHRVVLANCYSVGQNYASVLPDDASGGYLQAKHLLQLGHRRIGGITLAGDLPATRLRGLGARRAFAEAGAAIDESLFLPGFSGPVRQEKLLPTMQRWPCSRALTGQLRSSAAMTRLPCRSMPPQRAWAFQSRRICQ
jgi:LacI family transcriptional regulator